MSVPSLSPLRQGNSTNRIATTALATATTTNAKHDISTLDLPSYAIACYTACLTMHTQDSVTRRAIRYVRVETNDVGPPHTFQRFALASAVPCAKILESIPATRVYPIRELVHAVASLGTSTGQQTHIHASTQHRVHTFGDHALYSCVVTQQQTKQPHTAQLPSSFAQIVTMHLFGSTANTHKQQLSVRS